MKNAVTVVTSARQGIGRSTAIRLAQDFSSIVPVVRNREKARGHRPGGRIGGALDDGSAIRMDGGEVRSICITPARSGGRA